MRFSRKCQMRMRAQQIAQQVRAAARTTYNEYRRIHHISFPASAYGLLFAAKVAAISTCRLIAPLLATFGSGSLRIDVKRRGLSSGARVGSLLTTLTVPASCQSWVKKRSRASPEITHREYALAIPPHLSFPPQD